MLFPYTLPSLLRSLQGKGYAGQLRGGDILLLFDCFHTSMSAGVSSIQTLGLDTKLPEMLMASHQAGKVQPVSKYFTQKLMYKAHGKLFLRDVCGKCNKVGALTEGREGEGFCPDGLHWGLCCPGSYQMLLTQQQVAQPLSLIFLCCCTPHCCLLSLCSQAAGRACPLPPFPPATSLVPPANHSIRAVVLV